MIHRLKTPLLGLLFLLFAMPVLSMAQGDADIAMGPLLHFEGNDHDTWRVSALYVLNKGAVPEDLAFLDNDYRLPSFGEVIGEKFGHKFVRYHMTVFQASKEKTITYSLPGEKRAHHFFVPAKGQEPNILFTSCNGYQSEIDRKSVGGITPMWGEINARHREEHLHLQLGGGDQIYADGLINNPKKCTSEPTLGKTHGVFALPSLQPWIKAKTSMAFATFTEEMAQEVDEFYFGHYMRHYNELEFKETMASVPAVNQPDDHDYFDGCGSYPEFLQNSNVMAGIRKIATWYAFTIQHSLEGDKFPKMTTSGPLGHSFLHVLNDGKLAILGVDTRTERTQFQIVAQNSWDNIFDRLERLGTETKHVIVILGVPVVYASSQVMEQAFTFGDVLPTVGSAMSLLPGFEKNAFGLFELADDARDSWNHGAHVEERNSMIQRFQEYALRTHRRVTFLSGDVHLGGVGKIYCKTCGIEDCSEKAIWQIISSPVGNITPGHIATKALCKSACKERDLNGGCAMRIFNMRNEKSHEKAKKLIAHRNFITFKLEPNLSINFRLSAEGREGQEHTIYYVKVPPPQ